MKLKRSSFVAMLVVTCTLHEFNAVAQLSESGNALSGTNDGTVIITLPAAIPDNYTLSTWVYLRAGTAGFDPGTGLLSSPTCGNTTELLLRGNNAGSPQSIALARCNSYLGDLSSNAVPLNTWMHVAVAVSSSKQVNYYVNGAPAGSWNANGLDVSIGPSFNLGDNGYRRFNGILDEFQVWTNALPPSQIQTNVYRKLAGNEPGLYLYYRFNSSSGTVATNSATVTAGFYNGTLTVVSGSPGWVPSGVPGAPAAYTSGAAAVLETTATLKGGVRPNGLPTTAWFEWGPTVSYGNTSAPVSMGSGSGSLTTSLPITGLSSYGALYHFRLVASNNAAISYGGDLTFRTRGGTNIVTTLTDSGPGSLRAAIADSGGGGLILFATNGTITLTSGELLIGQDLTLIGPGATNLTIRGNGASRVFNIAAGAVNISSLTIRDGRSRDGADGTYYVAAVKGAPGGGIYSAGIVALSNCVVTGNSTGRGGNGDLPVLSSPTGDGGAGGNGAGIFNGGTLTLFACTVSLNTNGRGGTGASYTSAGFAGGGGGNGAGLYNTSGGSAAVISCTFNGNTTGTGGNAGNGGANGGVGGNGGAIFSAGQLTLTACTLDGNQASGGGNGTSGPFVNGISGNGGSGGGIYSISAASAQNLLIAQNNFGVPGGGSGGIGAPGAGPDVAGTFTSLGRNLIGITNGSSGFGINGDLTGNSGAPINPKLGPLQRNGGTTPTMALLPDSPALEKGDDALTGTDQRGQPRTSGFHVDIGAFELQISPLSAVPSGVSFGAPEAALGHVPVTLNAWINPGGLFTSALAEFGLTPAYGGSAPIPLSVFDTTNLPVNATVNLAPGLLYHWHVVATNIDWTVLSPDQVFTTPARYPLGDANGDGVVDQSELTRVLSNYFPTSPWLYLTNVAGLGGTIVTFALTNSTAGAFSVEYSTNLTDWYFLGPAIPRYLFADTNAPPGPQRFYRLRWP